MRLYYHPDRQEVMFSYAKSPPDTTSGLTIVVIDAFLNKQFNYSYLKTPVISPFCCF